MPRRRAISRVGRAVDQAARACDFSGDQLRQLVDAIDWMLCDAVDDVGQPSLWINIVAFGGSMSVYMIAARRPPASEPAKR